MLNEEGEQQNEFKLPRIAVRMPEPATWKMTVAELKRYEDSKLIVGNEGEPDVKSREKIDAEYAAKVKEAHVDAIAKIILDKAATPSLISLMYTEGSKILDTHEALVKAGVLPTEIAHATEKMPRVFTMGEKGTHGYILRTGNGEEKPASTLRISSWVDENLEGESSVTFGLIQKQGPWSGNVEIIIPVSHVEGDKERVVPDSTNSRIISASGTLEKMKFEEAAKLMIDTANAAAQDFEDVVEEIDFVFKDAESRL